MKAVFYLDAMLFVLPLVLMLYTFVLLTSAVLGDYHFMAVNGKVERLVSLSSLLIYEHSKRENGAVVMNYVEGLPSHVDGEFPVRISTRPVGKNCIVRIVYNGDFQSYYFCGG